MKFHYSFILILALSFILASCGDKNQEDKNVTKPEVKQEAVQLDTVKKEPVVEKVVEPEPEPEWPKTIIVQQGDWIYDIARREYGSMFAWRKIYKANEDKISDPNMIYPGQKLILPE